MYIDYFSIAFLVLALALSIANIYSMFVIHKHLKSEVVNKDFEFLKKELSILEQKQLLHQTQTQLNTKHLVTFEQILSALLAQHGGLGGDDTVH
jgi:aminoglycoside/choline kinase family phosphotransferase